MQWQDFYYCLQYLCLVSTSMGRITGSALPGLKFQPSEFVKIIFVFFVAALLSKAKEFKDLVKITVIAALYVLVLVVEKDLGGALLYFVIYLMMLYVATAKASYLFGGLAAGSVAAIIADKIFTHVQIRVAVWKDPFSMIEGRDFRSVNPYLLLELEAGLEWGLEMDGRLIFRSGNQTLSFL